MMTTNTPHAFVDAAIDEIIHATMPDGSPVSIPVKVSAILAQAGLASAPKSLERLLASSIGRRARKGRHRAARQALI